jgi:hypothetical protein
MREHAGRRESTEIFRIADSEPRPQEAISGTMIDAKTAIPFPLLR